MATLHAVPSGPLSPFTNTSRIVLPDGFGLFWQSNAAESGVVR
jgi:hypothetical protein